MKKKNKTAVHPAKTMDDWWPTSSPEEKREYREAVYEYLRIGLRAYGMIGTSEEAVKESPLTEESEDETIDL